MKKRGIYRQVPTSIWNSYDFYENMDTDEKFMYLYLITNPETNLLGCYILSPRKASIDTGFNTDEVIKLIEKLNKYKKVFYDNETKEIYIPEIQSVWTRSPKYISALETELEEVQSVEFKQTIERELNDFKDN